MNENADNHQKEQMIKQKEGAVPFPQKVIETLKKTRSSISNSMLDEHGIRHFLLQIEEWNSITIYMTNLQYKTILHEMINIKFNCLKKLVLWYNEIESVEGIHRIGLFTLHQLNISSNLIWDFTEFRKASFPNLRNLYLSNNKGGQCRLFPQMYAPKLKIMATDLAANQKFPVDITWVMKMQTANLNGFWIQSRSRIAQKNLKQKFSQKYNGQLVTNPDNISRNDSQFQKD